jgi:hypothetical protein
MSAGGTPYEPPESLWQLVQAVANERELDVIKRVVGESLVETSLDLHAEIDTLLEIWRDYRHETVQGLNRLRQSKRDLTNNLPEPPNQRETLKKEIAFFVKQLRETFNDNGDRFASKILSKNHNLSVINYVLNTDQSFTSPTSSTSTLVNGNDNGAEVGVVRRPGSSLGRDGLETPTMRRRPSRAASSAGGEETERGGRVRYRSESRLSGVSSSRLETPMSDGFGHRSRFNNSKNGASAFQEELEMVIDEDKLNVQLIDQCVDHLK